MELPSTLDDEAHFIQHFASSRYAARLLTLRQPKRRKDFLAYFRGFQFLNPTTAVPVPSRVLTAEVIALLRQWGSPVSVRVVSEGRHPLGGELPLAEAIESTYYASGTLVICVPGQLYYCAGEDGTPAYIVTPDPARVKKLI